MREDDSYVNKESELMKQVGRNRARGLFLAGLGLIPLAMAQQQGSGSQAASSAVLDEVIVTAQRREQSVQDIPIAVSAFSAAELERRQVVEALDLARVVPNLVGHNNTGPGNSNAYFLRGLGNTESVATFDPPVGTYVDDVYISRQSANNYALFDVERIEVLRGPQGTLFGRNTTGGAINVITRKPSAEFGAEAELGLGAFNARQARASLDLPVSDRFLTKFSGFYQEADGFVRSTVTGERNNDVEGYGARIALRALPTDAVTWDTAFEYVYNSQLNLIRICNPAPGQTAPDASCRFGADNRVNRTGFTQRAGSGSLLDQARRGEGLGSATDTLMFASNLTVEIGGVDLNFITGYREENWEYIIDFVPLGVPMASGFAISNDQKTDQFTQEVKATGTLFSDVLRYTAGVFYIDENNRTDFQDISGSTLLIDRVMRNSTESTAVYAQFDYNVTDAVTLTAGARYTEERKDIGFVSRSDRGAVFNISTAELIAGGTPVKQSISEITPKFGAEYRSSPDWLWYASATKGFKSGGWNGRGGGTHAALNYLPFGPEFVWSYEGGFKSELLGNTMRLNATAFWAEATDLQLVSSVQPGGPGTPLVFLTQNSGEARFRGVEIEWNWLATDDLNLYASLGLMDAEYTAITPQPQAQVTTNTQPVRAPDITGNVGATYTFLRDVAGGKMYVGGDAAFTGTHWVQSANTPAAAYVPRRWLYQVQAGYESDSGRWTAILSCKNCSDEEFITSYFVGPYMGDPRTWDLRVGYRFN